jgi:hypothetical protein
MWFFCQWSELISGKALTTDHNFSSWLMLSSLACDARLVAFFLIEGHLSCP